MTDKVRIEKKEDYILVSVSDIVITAKRAHEILNLIGEESIRLKCNKVLLDARSVEHRDLSAPELMELSTDMAKKGLNKTNIAICCKSNLIDRDSELFSLFTYTKEYVIQYFSESNEAIAWLKTKNPS